MSAASARRRAPPTTERGELFVADRTVAISRQRVAVVQRSAA